MRRIACISVCMLLAGMAAAAQEVDPAELLHPPSDTWLTYHGDYTGRRHSALTGITPENVARLKQVWRSRSGRTRQSKLLR